MRVGEPEVAEGVCEPVWETDTVEEEEEVDETHIVMVFVPD